MYELGAVYRYWCLHQLPMLIHDQEFGSVYGALYNNDIQKHNGIQE